MITMKYGLPVLALTLLTLVSCTRTVPFEISSLDHSGDKPLAKTYKGMDIQNMSKALIVVLGNRGGTLIDRTDDEDTDTVGLVFQIVDKNYASRSTEIKRASRFYFSLAPSKSKDGVRVTVVGAPFYNGVASCPEWVAERFGCTDKGIQIGMPDLEREGQIAGIDLTGQREADDIKGIFAELSVYLESETNAD
jgi:hypothetical protein